MTALSDRQALRQAVAAGLRAPSVHNTQPWRFLVDDDGITVAADDRRRLEILDPSGRQLVISCGAAITNIDVALRAAGLQPSIELLPSDQPAVLARITITAAHAPTAFERSLAESIPLRATERHALDGAAVSRDLLVGLARIARSAGGRLCVVDDVATHAAVDSLTTVADRVQAGSPSFRAELRRWVRSDDGAGDGIPFSSRGLGAAGGRLLHPPVRDFDVDGRAARRAAEDAAGDVVDRPVLAVLWTDGDDPRSWLRAGMALERVLLAITSAGFAASFVNQPVDDPGTRRILADQLGIDGHAQTVLRIGRSRVAATPTPRRPADEVVSFC